MENDATPKKGQAEWKRRHIFNFFGRYSLFFFFFFCFLKAIIYPSLCRFHRVRWISWINWFVNQTPLWSFCPSFKRTTKALSTEMSSTLWARKSGWIGKLTWIAARTPLWMMEFLKVMVRDPVASHFVWVVLSQQKRCRGLVSFVVVIWIHCVVSSFIWYPFFVCVCV